MMSELKPCPCCGAEAKLHNQLGGNYYVMCENPKCKLRTGYCVHPGTAEKNWNARKGEN